MDALAYDLKLLARGNRDGSHATQANRQRTLSLVADELKALGFKLPAARSLRPKHIRRLVQHWQGRDLNHRTIKNRLAVLRWTAAHIGKANIIERTNEAYGLSSAICFTARAKPLDREKLAAISSEHIRMSLELAAAFGLRREESMKIIPELADCGGFIRLQPSWTKGGRLREIPITHDRQREILNRAKATCNGGSLIPSSDTYKMHLKRFEYQTLKVGLRNPHALRHAWAQWRYKQLTGFDCPAAGGAGEAFNKRLDQMARQKVTRELGHERPEITNIYLGRNETGRRTFS